MEHVRKSTYWLILPILMIVVLVLSLAAAPTQSRFTTVTGWQMTLSQVEETLHCDLLTQQGQKIRLQDMTVGDIQQIQLNLTAVGDAENVTVSVESQYLTVDMELIGSIYDRETLNQTLTLAANEGAMQTVTTPTEASAQVTLTWDGGSLQGEFLVRLLPREAPPEDTGDGEESTGDSSNDTTETPDEVTDTPAEENEENIQENGGNSEETTLNQEENTEIQTTGDGAAGDDTTGGDTTGDDTTGDDTNETPVEPEVGNWLSGMTSFAADGVLPLWVDIPEGCGEVQVELGADDAPAGVFPAGTRYSTDGGASYTLLYDPYVIGFTPEEGAQTASVLVDFSAVEISEESLLTVTASAIKEGQIFTVSSIPAQATLKIPAAELDTNPPVLTAERSIQFVMPVYGDSHSATVTPLRVEQTEGLPSMALEDGILTISSDGGAAKPGTYLTTLTWHWKGLEIARQEFTFYVNYTPYVTNP